MSARSLLALLACLTLAWPRPSRAQEVVNVGVYLPLALGDGDQRFDYGEDSAAAISASGGLTAKARVYSKLDDFVRAFGSGAIDVAAVDGWVAVQLGERLAPFRELLDASNARGHLALVSTVAGGPSELKGKRLAMVKGANAGADAKLLSNVLFYGLMNASESFSLTQVPTRESALRMLELKSAELALLPSAAVPEGSQVVYRSEPIPLACLVLRPARQAELRRLLAGLKAVEPFRLGADPSRDVARLTRLLERGPPQPLPELSGEKSYRPPLRGATLRHVPLALPRFEAFVEAPSERPEDW